MFCPIIAVLIELTYDLKYWYIEDVFAEMKAEWIYIGHFRVGFLIKVYQYVWIGHFWEATKILNKLQPK